MYNSYLHQLVTRNVEAFSIDIAGSDNLFYVRLLSNIESIHKLYYEIYPHHDKKDDFFSALIALLCKEHKERTPKLKAKDEQKAQRGVWFLSNEIAGMSLYVDRFCGSLRNIPEKLPYLDNLGINLLHLMPVFESPQGESDGGYAVSNFRKVDARFGTNDDLQGVIEKLADAGKFLMLDIVLNHTSHRHEWAERAKSGDKVFQDYYYTYNDRSIPDQFDAGMPEIFPESSPGNFTFDKEMNKWVMTVFHHYQWDLNYTNPQVFVAMLDNVLYYANLGVDILRIDAPAFIWKEPGTSCQNLPKAHTLLRLIKLCVQTVSPGMAILGEAIVAPAEIMKYFGEGDYTARECDFAYNATQMALQWDALATGEALVMFKAQYEILRKPYGTSWITYTRCHDDIGLGYDDSVIRQAGKDPLAHRTFLKNSFTGRQPGSFSKGALFGVNPKTNDARISGTLASLCGLETALEQNDNHLIDLSIARILLMQAQSMLVGGIPMLFYGDEAGYTNDYTYLSDTGKSYDNRWMHRPIINWAKNEAVLRSGSIEERIYSGTKKLLSIRKSLTPIADHANLQWMNPHNTRTAGFIRQFGAQSVFCVFNYSAYDAYLTWYAFREFGGRPAKLYDHWTKQEIATGADHEFLVLAPYQFQILEWVV